MDARAQQRDHGPVVLGRASQTPRSAPPASGGRRAPAAGQSAAVGRGRERDVWLGYWAGCVGLSGPKGGGFGSTPSFPDSNLLESNYTNSALSNLLESNYTNSALSAASRMLSAEFSFRSSVFVSIIKSLQESGTDSCSL